MLSKQVKFMAYCLPIAAILIGLLVTEATKIKEIDSGSSSLQSSVPTQPSNEQLSARVYRFMSDAVIEEFASKCRSSVFFTSAPAKCLDANGNLIWVKPGSPIVPVSPQK